MIHIWRRDIPLARALRTGQLEALAPKHLRRALPAWLRLNPLAAIPPARKEIALADDRRTKSA